MTYTLTAGTALEFLGLVPAMLGFHPQRSLVLIPLDGIRSCGAIRVDLDTTDHPHEFAATTLGIICRVPKVTGVVAVIYTDDESPTTRTLADALTTRANQIGLNVADSLYVARDGWGSHFNSENPQPTDQITTPAGLPTIAASQEAGSEIPHADPARLTTVTAALARVTDRSNPLDTLTDTCERALAADPADVDPADAALILLALSVPITRDVALIQWATTPIIGAAALAAAANDDRQFSESIARVLFGDTDRQPAHARLSAALTLVRHLIALTPENERAGVLTAAAWLSWALGRSTHAAIYADHALAIEPEHTLAQMVATFVRVGHIAAFAFMSPRGGDQ